MPKSRVDSNNSDSSDGGDDFRKKRGNSQDERETSKKVRSSKQKCTDEEVMTTAESNQTLRNSNDTTIPNKRSTSTVHTKSLTSDDNAESCQRDQVWDLESAILYLTQIPINSSKRDSNESISKEKRKDSCDDRKENSKKPGNDTTTTDHGGKTEEVNEGCSLVREHLTKDQNSWISFRAAHAGDASTIAQWYHKQRLEDRQNRRRRRKSRTSSHGENVSNSRIKSENESAEEEIDREPEDPEIDKQPLRLSSSNEDETARNDIQNDKSSDDDVNQNNSDDGTLSASMQLEHWLAEGLGDENTCPFVHGLLAHIHQSPNEEIGSDSENNADEEKNCAGGRLAAVVLMSLSWALGKRNLRIEWMSVDASAFLTKNEGLTFRQKVWLRIHTLSAMTACQAISVEEDVLISSSEKDKQILASKEFEMEEPLEGLENTKVPLKKSSLSSNAVQSVEPSAE